jgi:cytochrome P450
MAPFPSLTCRKIIAARETLQTAMREYYNNKSDQNEDVSVLIRDRAAMLRDAGLSDDDVGGYEILIVHVAITNTIGTGFWFFAFIHTTPGLVDSIREEAKGAIQRDANDEVTIDIAHIAETCPLLLACYRETLRLTNQFIGNRQIMTDTTVSDSQNRTYFLKKGTSIQWPARFLHTSKEIWGDDAMDFKPERFLEVQKNPDSQDTKTKMASYIPYGGGKHYCPGRAFAQAENVGFILTIILGYEVSPLKGDWSTAGIPGVEVPSFASAVYKPANDGEGWGVKMQKREGWENATWKYLT